jgi:outer membrane protein assembly factor BamB
VLATLAVNGGAVFAKVEVGGGGGGSALVALNASTGARLWRRALDFSSLSAPSFASRAGSAAGEGAYVPSGGVGDEDPTISPHRLAPLPGSDFLGTIRPADLAASRAMAL